MYLEGIFGSGQTSSTFAASAYRKLDEENISKFPASWGSDSVRFSPEALEAASSGTVSAESKAAAGNENETHGTHTEEPENDAAAEFAKYLRQARGEEADTALSPEEMLEKLKEKLQKLADQKAKVAADENTSEDVKQAQLAALDAQMSGVASQIAELTSQLAEMSMGK